MQVLLNCHLAALLEFEWTIEKSSQMTIYSMHRKTIFIWPQLAMQRYIASYNHYRIN